MCPICAKAVNAVEVRGESSLIHGKGCRKYPQRKISGKISRISPKLPEELTYELVSGFGRKIKNAREKLGLRRDELARRLGISGSTLKKIETGKLKPDLALARRLEKILHIRILRKIDVDLLEIISKVPKEESKPLTIGDVMIIEKPKKKKR